MRQFLIIIACLLVSLLRSQEVIIQPPIFSEFECTEFYQLYTGSIMNFSTETYQANMILEVDYTSPAGISNSIADGILTGGSNLSINPGKTPINNGTYETFYSNRQIIFYDTDFESQIAITKCLPPGTYEVCLTLVDPAQGDNPTNIISQTCYVREKQMLTQLLLVSPFENDEIIVDLPLFTWTPVTPVIPSATYTIQIVELFGDQSPFEAFRANPIFFEQSGLMTNIFQYPVAARTMIPCTRYAWRVMYTLDGSFVNSAFLKEPDFLQSSEVWEFHIGCEDEEEEEELFSDIDLKYFYKVGSDLSSSYYTHYGKDFRFEIDNPYQDLASLNVQIELEDGSVQSYSCCDCWGCGLESSDDDQKYINDSEGSVKQGKNYLYINLEEYGLEPGQHYKMIFTDFKNDLFINFKYEEDEK